MQTRHAVINVSVFQGYYVYTESLKYVINNCTFLVADVLCVCSEHCKASVRRSCWNKSIVDYFRFELLVPVHLGCPENAELVAFFPVSCREKQNICQPGDQMMY